MVGRLRNMDGKSGDKEEEKKKAPTFPESLQGKSSHRDPFL